MQALAHVRRFLSDGGQLGLRSLQVPGQAERADDDLNGALDLLEHRLLEEVGVEQRAQDRFELEAGVDEDAGEVFDRLRVARRFDVPGRHLGFVGDEEVVEMAADEAGAGGLFEDDVDDVEAVEVARAPEEGLLAVVVLFGAELVLEEEAVVGHARHLRADGPAGEGAGALEDIGLGVVADAEREQFEQLAAPVFVGRALVVLVVVEPVNHGRVLRQHDQQVAVVARAVIAPHVDLRDQVIVVVHLGVAGGEDMVPEERHFLFQRALGVDHLEEPVGRARRGDRAAGGERGHVAEELVDVGARHIVGRVDQLFDNGFVALGGAPLKFVAVRAEAGAAHQVRHQRDVVWVGHHAASKIPRPRRAAAAQVRNVQLLARA